MRWTYPSLIVIAAAVVAMSASGCGRAEALESFTLEEHDHLLAEAPGCYSECRSLGMKRRVCTIKDPTCHAVCQSIPECKPDGLHMIKVCAVMKTTRF